MTNGRLRIGVLAQENVAVPPPQPGASVARVVYELSRELVPRFDVAVCSIAHPTIPDGLYEGVQYLRVPHGLDRRRHYVFGQAIRVARRLDIPYRGLQGVPGYSKRYAVEGLRRLAEYDPHVVHLHNISQFVPIARRLVPNAKIVIHMHNTWLSELPRRTVLSRLREVDLILGVSEYITNEIRNAVPELGDRCECFHNGVDITAFMPRSHLDARGRAAVAALREQWRAGEGPVVLTAAMITPEKGTDVLLRAFARVLNVVPDATLVLAGAFGRYFTVTSPGTRRDRKRARLKQKYFRDLVGELASQLGERVVFAGNVGHGELSTYYAAADVYTLPSIWQEPFSLTALEACACALPVVASRSGGLPEVIRDGENGLVVPMGDPVALGDALTTLCRDLGAARRLGERGRELMGGLTWRLQANALAATYSRLADMSQG